jgi:ribosomal protection tetracycline resistance protein
VSFVIDDITVNLIDTPGHPDFITEVERVFSVLDGAVLVVSAVEGVQTQTRVLMRTLQRLRIPTLIFVNKVDRGGAQYERVLQSISERLAPPIVPMGSVNGLGTREAVFTPFTATDADDVSRLVDLLADHDDAFLAAYVDDETTVSCCRLRGELAAQTEPALVHLVFFGSAITGAGVDALTAGINELLPAAQGDVDGPASGTVFKIERGPSGERIAYDRLFSGTVRTRDRLQLGQGSQRKVTADQRLRPRLGRPAGVGLGWADREALGSGRDSDRRRDRSIATDLRALVRPADIGGSRCSLPGCRQGCATCRARPARSAGPTDQRAAGRPAAGGIGIALR